MVQHRLDVAVGIVRMGHHTDVIHILKIEVLVLRNAQKGLTFSGIQELTFFIQQLEGIPLFGVVGCRQNDTPLGFFKHNGHFHGRSGCQTCIHHIDTTSQQGTTNHQINHLARDPSIPAHHNFEVLPARETLLELYCVCSCKFHNIDGSQCIAHGSTNGSPNSGDGLDECHNCII